MGNNITGQESAAALREQLRNGEGKARGALAALFDGGSFAEFGAYVKRIPGELETAEQADFEGVVTGYGSVAGRLTYAFVQDIGRNKGAFSAVQAEKILRLYDAALKNEAPIVGVFDSAGAFVLGGVSVLAGYGRMMKKIRKKRPRIRLRKRWLPNSRAVCADRTVSSASRIWDSPPWY